MAYDGIVTKTIVNELENSLVSGKIDKIFQPNKLEIVLGIYANKLNYALYISVNPSNPRCNLTTTVKPNPITALNFCMVLRKHLIGYKIKKISNYDLERVIKIELEGLNELHDIVTKTLIIEIMGKYSNIILVNDQNKIIDSIRHVDNSISSKREVLIAREYILPEITKKSFITSSFYDFYKDITSIPDVSISNLGKAISEQYIGLSKSFLDYHIGKLDIQIIDEPNLSSLYNKLQDVIAKSSENKVQCIDIIDKNGKLKDYALDVNESAETASPLPINFYLDDYYSRKEEKEGFTNYRNHLLKVVNNAISKYIKRLGNIEAKLKETNEMDKYKIYGDLIISNIHKVVKNEDSVTLENFYEDNKLVTIPLESSLSPSENATKYFKKYTKLKNTSKIVGVQILQTKAEIEYIENLIYDIGSCTAIKELQEIEIELIENNLIRRNNKQKKDKSEFKKGKQDDLDISGPIKFIIQDFTVLVGKNNKQNDTLTFKTAKNNDIWFHTKDVHGSHVILKVENKEDKISESILSECAALAAYYSKARETSKVKVDYTRVKYVKKIPGAKPGMVTYTNQKTIIVKPRKCPVIKN